MSKCDNAFENSRANLLLLFRKFHKVGLFQTYANNTDGAVIKYCLVLKVLI